MIGVADFFNLLHQKLIKSQFNEEGADMDSYAESIGIFHSLKRLHVCTLIIGILILSRSVPADTFSLPGAGQFNSWT